MSADPGTRPARSRTPRRRRAARLIRAILALLIAALLGVWYLLETDATAERVRGLIEDRASAALGAPVTIDRLELDAVPFHLVAHDLRIGTPTPTLGAADEAEPPQEPGAAAEELAGIDRVVLDISPWGLLRNRITILNLELHRPRIDLNLPLPSRPGGGTGALTLEMRRLLVRDGALRFAHREARIDGELEGIALQLAPESGGFLASQRTDGVGSLRIAGGRLDLSDRNGPAAVLDPIEVDLSFGLGERVLDVDSLRLTAGQSTLQISGAVRGFDSAALEVAGDVAIADIFRVWVPPGPQDHGGRTDFRGTLQLRDGAPVLAGRLSAGEIRTAGLAVDRLIADLELHGEAVVLENVRAELYGGTLDGELRVDRTVDPARIRIDYEASGIDTAAVSRWQPTGGFRLAGQLGGTGTIAWSRPFSATAEGSGTLQLQLDDVGSLELSRRLLDAADPAVEIASDDEEPDRLSTRRVGHASPSLPLPADARIEYRIAGGTLQLPDATIALPNATIAANGRVDLDGPVQLSVTADATDLRMIDHVVAQYRAFREGRPESRRLGLRGAGRTELQLTGTLRALDVAGTVRTTGLAVDDLVLGDVAGSVSTRGRALISTDLVVRRGGGTATGRAQLRLPGGTAAEGMTDYEVDLRLADYALEAERDFAGLPRDLTGRAEGTFSLRGNWGEAPLGPFDLVATDARLGRLPMPEISLRGRRTEAAWIFESLRVRSFDGLVEGGGLWGTEDGLLAISGTGRGLSMRALCNELDCGRAADGSLEFEAELSGRVDALDGDLRITWSDARVGELPLGRVVAAARAEAGVIAARLLGSTGNVELPMPEVPRTTTPGTAPTLLPEPEFGWSASATLGSGSPWPLAVRVRADADVAVGLLEQIGEPLPANVEIGGQLDARARGEIGNLATWRGTATVAGLRIRQPPRFLATADELVAELSDGHVRTTAQLATSAGELAIDAEIGLEDGSLSGALEGSWDLVGLRLADESLEVAGTADLDLDLGGTTSDPRFDGGVRLRNVSLDDAWMYPLEGLEADLSLSGGALVIDRATGTFGGDAFRLSGRLPLAALAGNDSAEPSRIVLEADELSIVPVVARSETIHRLVTDGAIGGRLEASGIGLDWKTWRGTASVQYLELRMRDYVLRTTDGIEATIADARVTIPAGTRIREVRTDLTVGGHVDLSPLAIDLDLDGRVGFEPLNILSDAWGTGGVAQVDLRVHGPADDLAWDGTAEISGAVLSTPVLRQPIESIRGRVIFDTRRLRIEDGVGELGGGGVTLSGEMFLQQNALRSFRVAATVDNATIRLERDVRVRASADVIHDGTPAAALVSGTVTLHEAMYRRELSADAALLEMLEAPETDPDPLLQAVALDLRVRGTDGLFIDNNLANVEVTADLNVRGTAARPVVLGRTVVLGGQMFWNDNVFDITQGTVEYNNPFETDPTFEIRARTEIRRYTIDLTFSGSLQRGVSFNYTSTPSLSDLDLFNLLAFGEEPDSAVFQDPYSYQRALGLQATRYLTDAYLSEVEQGAARLFGIDRFRIAPTVTGEETDATARLTVGKRIDRNLYVTYSRLLSNSEDQLLTVEYRLTPNIRLKGTRDEDGSFGIDVLIQRRIR